MIKSPGYSIVSTFGENEAFLILCVQVGTLHIGMSLISPILPLYAQMFGVSVALIGFLLTIQFVSRILLNVPAGRLANRWGAHRMLTAASVIAAVSAVAAAGAPSYFALLLTRLLQGVATGVSQTAGFAYAANVSKAGNRARVISLYQGSFLLGNSVGPVIGGYTAEYFGYRAPFIVYAVLALLVGLWMFLRLPDPRGLAGPAKPRHKEAGFFEAMRQMLRHRGILLGSVIGFMGFYTGGGSRNMAIPLRGSELGLSESQIGLAVTMEALK